MLIIKKMFMGLFFCGILFLSSLISAEEMKPVIVISQAGYDATWNGVDLIADQMGYGPAVKAYREMIAKVQGLDTSKPFGFVLMLDGNELVPFGFVPVADFNKLEFLGIDSLKDNIKTVEGKLLYKVNDNIQVQLLEKDGWLYIIEPSKAKLITNQKPEALLEGLDKEYLLGAKLYFENMPKDLLEIFMAPIRQNLASADESVKQQVELLDRYMNTLLSSVRVIRGGIKVDAKSSDLSMNVNIETKKGSSFSKTIEGTMNAKSKWIDLFKPENNVFSCIEAQSLSSIDKTFVTETYAMSFDNFIKEIDKLVEDKKDREDAKTIVNNLKTVFLGAFEKNIYSYAMTLTTEPLLIFATDIAHGDLLSKTLEQVRDYYAKDFEDFIKQNVSLEAGRANSYKVAIVTIPLGDLDCKDMPLCLVKKQVCILIGIRQEGCVVLVGLDKAKVTDFFKNFVSIIDKEGSIPQPQAVLSLKGIGNMLDIAENDKSLSPKFIAIRKILKSASDKATITVTNEWKPDSATQTEVINGECFNIIGKIINVLTKGDKDDSNSKKELEEADKLFN